MPVDANLMAILSAGTGGAANILARKFSGLASANGLLIVNFALMTLLLLPAAPFFFKFEFTQQAIVIFLFAAMMDAAANLAYFKAFEKLPAVIASLILAVSPVVTLVFQPVFSPGTKIDGLMIFGIFLASGGLMLLARSRNGNGSAGIYKRQHLIWPALAAGLFGLNIYPIRYLLQEDFTNPYTYYLLRAPLIAISAWLVLRPKFDWVTGRRLLAISGRLVFVIAQWLLLLSAIEIGNPSVVKTIADTSPLFVLVLAGIVLHERVTNWQILGVLMTVGGMVLAIR